MLRIRFHGRGGQGVKTASQVLSGALFAAGYEVQDAPRYGAERRGAPIFAYVRADRAPIRERGVIAQPDLVVVVDDTLVSIAAAGALQGLDADAVLLIAGDEAGEAWRDRLKLPCTVLSLPGSSRDAMRCAGAAARLIGIGRAGLQRAIEGELGPLGAAAVAQSCERALAAFDAFAVHAGRVRARPEVQGHGEPTDWIAVPLEAAAVSAPDIRAPASSAASQTGLWRAMRPVIDYDLCRRCSWVCSTYCPDSAIRVGAEGRPEIDYDHCKGCMVCVTVCPPHAIRAVPETGQPA